MKKPFAPPPDNGDSPPPRLHGAGASLEVEPPSGRAFQSGDGPADASPPPAVPTSLAAYLSQLDEPEAWAAALAALNAPTE